SVPTNWHSFTYYKNNVRGRVEKYFFGTSPTAQTVGISIFIEGGSVTLSEALACEVPLIIYNPVPGHEEENVKVLINQGAAIKAEMSEAIPLLLERVLYEAKYYERMKQSARKLKRPNAAKDCVSIILKRMEKEKDSPNDEPTL
ncbi:glycosyltransferase, partial [Anaerobacillus arseniciselenatis]|uniref:glycosyltransferase n=1 Tax=Anaerobacillus arseniciselenatis TaxID=85682 RepID=UPI00111413E0